MIGLFAHTSKKIACQPSGTLGLKQIDDFKIYSLTQALSKTKQFGHLDVHQLCAPLGGTFCREGYINQECLPQKKLSYEVLLLFYY